MEVLFAARINCYVTYKFSDFGDSVGSLVVVEKELPSRYDLFYVCGRTKSDKRFFIDTCMFFLVNQLGRSISSGFVA